MCNIWRLNSVTIIFGLLTIVPTVPTKYENIPHARIIAAMVKAFSNGVTGVKSP